MTDIDKQKLVMWKDKLKQLEKELDETMIKKGKAAQEGDLSENAAYKEFIEMSEMYSAQIANVQRIIKNLERVK
jgi:transcription elongation GreA/GreB family factor